MLDTAQNRAGKCRVAVIWIDWYAYHVARLQGLLSAPGLAGRVVGIELVGGVGVHKGLKFREELPAGLPVETLMPEASWREAGQLRLAVALWRRLSELDPEVVLAPGYYTLPGIAAALWAKLHRRKSVLMTESTAYDHQRTGRKEKAKSLLIRGLFDWAVTGGKAHVRYLHQLGFPSARIAHYYDVVDNGFFSGSAAVLRRQSASEFGLPARYFLYIGRLAPEKNIGGLLSSWIAYRSEGGTWPLVVVGDGPASGSLRAMAAASSFGADIHFAGHKDSRGMLPYHAFAGCFVLPSTREPWGLVVNEAMASGLPVIASNRCGSAEDLIVPGQNGLLFDPSQSGQLAERLHEMEQVGLDRLKQMGEHAAQTVSSYSPESFGREIARIADS